MDAESSAAICTYCRKHRWCLQCKTGHEGETCATCGAALEPAPTVNAKLGGRLYHEPCAKVAEVLGMHQLLLSQVSGHAVSAYEAALQRVTKLNHTGWLDVRVSSDVDGRAIQSRVQFVLRGPKEKPRPGWFGLWISPDLVALMKASSAAAQEPAPQESACDRVGIHGVCEPGLCRHPHEVPHAELAR